MARFVAATCAALLIVVPSLGARTPNERRELTASSHGDRDWAALEYASWCPENEDYCTDTVIDYAVPEHWDRLPIHPGGTIGLRTGRPARGVKVSFRGTSRAAKRRDESGRRWRVRVPQSMTGKSFLDIDVDYRYRRDGKTWGGKYDFFLPVRQHRH